MLHTSGHVLPAARNGAGATGTARRGGRCPPSAIVGPMEPNVLLLAAAAVGLALAVALLLRLRGRRRRHKTKRAGLRQRAREESEALMALIREREAAKPADPDAAGLDPDEALRRATEHDEELRLTYRSGHPPRIVDLREQLAGRGIREGALDGAYESVSSEAEARIVSTALLVMADRLR